MAYFIQFIYGFFASMAFGVIFHTPKKALPIVGTIGGIGWIVYRHLLMTTGNTLASAMTAGLIIGTLSGILSIILKYPTILLYIPSLIPLVPGGGMYYTMYYLIMEEMDKFGAKALETTLIAIALATGIFLSTNIVNIINKIIHGPEERGPGDIEIKKEITR